MATFRPVSPCNPRPPNRRRTENGLDRDAAAARHSGIRGGTYLEGRAGAIGLADLSGQGTIDSAIGFARLTGEATGNIGYDKAIMLGAEVGVEGVFGTSLRLSASLDAFEPKVSSAVLTADLSINGVKVPDTPAGAPLGGKEVADLGLDFEHRTAILSGNALSTSISAASRRTSAPATGCCSSRALINTKAASCCTRASATT